MSSKFEIIPFKVFLKLVNNFSDELLELCQFFVHDSLDQERDTERLYARLIYASKLVEDLLDYHGAKNNLSWYTYRELVASVLNFSSASFTMKHITSRMEFYEIGQDDYFLAASDKVHKFLFTSLNQLCQRLLEEAQHLGLNIPPFALKRERFSNLSSDQLLESDIADQDLLEEKKNIVRITTAYLNICKEFEALGFYKQFSPDELSSIIPLKANEEVLRKYEMAIHNLQSSYDTYVGRHTRGPGSHRLKCLRDHISISLHLLELGGRLSHFYERHIYDVGHRNFYCQVQSLIRELVDPESLLDAIVNYAIFYCNEYLAKGKPLSQDLLNHYIQRAEITVGVPVKLGFHSRPCMLVAKIVQHYGGQVEMVVGEDRFDASSILELQWAGGKVYRENRPQVTFIGDARALADIQILASINYGEDTMGKGIPLPAELAYLK
ncbi:MAG: HPr family phosphocarrier protein [Deltaproteobacteria bacterium]|nr:HPr family phosphocarrier protein [Deltaproteobacteria bacterium]MBW1952568.1 HPr family phosphocarrier protein [Deltaproteobacteria bacterium]MBW1986135.1 HPr family phosphocarrier protein [Deltaproteobacteria bacterium]MBW2134179.1 HPr family phosphocarrier protein [Deltaproteobacteria bacterium]